MARRDITLNHSALEGILKSREVMEALRGIADDIIEATGMPEGEYVIEEWTGQNRDRVSIWTNGVPQAVREAKDHNLVRALGEVQARG